MGIDDEHMVRILEWVNRNTWSNGEGGQNVGVHEQSEYCQTIGALEHRAEAQEK